MILFVYSYFCFLIIGACQSHRTQGEDDTFVTEPEIKSLWIVMGTDLALKCNIKNHHHYNEISWEFKSCESNYQGVDCDTKSINDIKVDSVSWKKISNNGSGRLVIQNSTEHDNGLYRCLHNGFVEKSFVVQIVHVFNGPPPKVESLQISNSTAQLNMEFTILCNISSKIPPSILWFKKCNGIRCDIKNDHICYCYIHMNSSLYNFGNTYLSKLNIFDARSVDSGLYACLAVTEFGKDYKNVTINVPNVNVKEGLNESSFSLLFLIPFALILAPIAVWLCYFKRKKKSVIATAAEQQKCIKPVVKLEFVIGM